MPERTREHAITLERHDETLKDLPMESWSWVCSCGKRSQQKWLGSKYAARHAGENHVIRMKGK